MLPNTDTHSYVTEHLTLDGAGVTYNANVDGSGTAQLFKISPPASGKLEISRMLVEIEDGGVWTADKYGTLATLTNGVQVGLYNDSTDALVQDFTDGHPIKTNAGWGHFCYDVDLKSWGQGDSFLVSRWTFSKGGTIPVLTAHNGLALGVLIQDDLQLLGGQYFVVQGRSKGAD